MEKLADSGLLAGVIDVTTTEVCDLLMGGVFPCTEDRFGAIARTGVPYVGSCGALDMVNFGALNTVPAQYRERNLYVHNPEVTLMRTTRRRMRGSGTGSANASIAARGRFGSCCRWAVSPCWTRRAWRFTTPKRTQHFLTRWSGRCIRPHSGN